MRVPRSRGARIGVVVVAAVVVAEGAAWLLAPSDQGPEPLPVDEGELLPDDALERAREYRSGQRALGLTGLGVQGVALLVLASGRPAVVRRALQRAGARPVLGGLAAGAGLSLTLALVVLPLDVAAHERASDVGLSTQSLDAWLADAGRSAAISAALAGAGAALLLALIRRFERSWWLPGSAAVVGIAVLMSWLAPVVLAPVFNDFEELPEGSAARADVLELARRGGVDIGEVLSVDASRRSTALNAYVGGLGPTKRVVLYDNLIEEAERAELRSVVAHELGHTSAADIPRGIAFVALVAPLGLLLVRELGGELAARGGAVSGTPASLPAYALSLGVASFVLAVPGNQLSRAVERAADAYALELTEDPQALEDLQLRLGRENVSDPDPPAWSSFLFGTHPSTVERVGAARAYERKESTVAPSP